MTLRLHLSTLLSSTAMSVALLASTLTLMHLTSCRSSGTDEQGSAPSASGFELDLEKCAGFTLDDAAAFLEVPVSALQFTPQPLGENGIWCVFTNSRQPDKGMNFSITRAESEEQAALEFAQFRDNAGVANTVLGEPGEKAHDVSGVGDESLWTPVPGSLTVRKGRYTVSVNHPSNEELQVKIARKVLASNLAGLTDRQSVVAFRAKSLSPPG